MSFQNSKFSAMLHSVVVAVPFQRNAMPLESRDLAQVKVKFSSYKPKQTLGDPEG
jgi:hypothetical protein